MTNKAAIIVLYKQNNDILKIVVEQLKKHKIELIIVDNNESDDVRKIIELPIYHPNFNNKGLGEALNQGVSIAENLNFEYVLLLDQDSLMSDDYLEYYTREIANKSKQDRKVIFGANFSDRKINREQVVNNKKNYLITSGSIFSINSYKEIGPFKSELFIDYIDIEWCARAVNIFGYDLRLISEISINHSIGDNVRKLFNKYIFLHQPERDYYIIRNFYYVFRLNYIDKKYKLLELVKTLMRTILYIAYSNNKIKHAKYIVKGHVDGLKKRYGRGI